MAAAIIGIDLGTTFSAVANLDEVGRPKIVHNEEGQNITPSCIAVDDDGRLDVGTETARRQLALAPETGAVFFKRDMGTKATFAFGGREYTPTDLSAEVLKKIVKDVTGSVGQIGGAVVTIPANFAHEARNATLQAARHAGLDVKNIINEPTAAALYYAHDQGQNLSGLYAVYDLGGGTFDISIIRVEGHDVEVVTSNGVSRLGGVDFDKALQSLVAEKYAEAHGATIEEEDYSLSDAEDDKKSLSRRDKVTVRVARKAIEITRQEFEEAISALTSQAEMLCETSLEEAGISADDVKSVFLVGGSTRVPMVRESVKRVFKQTPVSTANVDEVVALGATLYAAYKVDHSQMSSVQRAAIDSVKVQETTGKCFGTISVSYNEQRDREVMANSIIIPKGAKIPCEATDSFYTVHDSQEGVDCKVTESTSPETDPRFVKVIWQGRLDLPSGRPAGQEIEVKFSYDENQVMNCAFVDKATNRREEIDLTIAGQNSGGDTSEDRKKFRVE